MQEMRGNTLESPASLLLLDQMAPKVSSIYRTLCFALFTAVEINVMSISVHFNSLRIQQSAELNRCFLAELTYKIYFNGMPDIVQFNLYNLVCFKSNLQQLTKEVSPRSVSIFV